MSEPQITTADGRQIAYETYGDSEGEAVLVLHGTPGSRLHGELYADIAEEESARILSPDRPGYGESDPWPDWGPTTAPDVLEAVLADAECSEARVVAFSNGAPFALAMAAERPDAVTDLHLVSASSPPDLGDSPPGALRLLGLLAKRAPPVAGALYRLQRWLASRDPEQVVGQLTTGNRTVPEGIARQVGEEIAEGLSGGSPGAVAETRLFTNPWEIDLDAVTVPVEITHGNADENAPIAGARALAERLPDADLHELEGADHLGTLIQSRRRLVTGLGP